eukprot:scaffold322034_cov17-Tisochrysis_lutea.AAC.1
MNLRLGAVVVADEAGPRWQAKEGRGCINWLILLHRYKIDPARVSAREKVCSPQKTVDRNLPEAADDSALLSSDHTRGTLPSLVRAADDAAAAEKRMKRAAKKRARAEAKAAREAALAAGNAGKGQGDDCRPEGGVGGGAAAPAALRQQQQQQRTPKMKKAGTFGMGDDDEFEVIPAAGSSDEGSGDEGAGQEKAM